MSLYDDNDPIFDEEARENHMKEIKKRRAEQYKRDRQQAIAFLVIFALVITGSIVYFVNSGSNKDEKQTSQIQQSISETESNTQHENNVNVQQTSHKTENIEGITYIDGIMIANKSYSLPSSFDPGLDPDA
ncbi:MAG: hypothetical protein K2F81_03745, partial [Ruminococcus sp.]|nr:hypothetical protein [Ruminococcus sp.]